MAVQCPDRAVRRGHLSSHVPAATAILDGSRAPCPFHLKC